MRSAASSDPLWNSSRPSGRRNTTLTAQKVVAPAAPTRPLPVLAFSIASTDSIAS